MAIWGLSNLALNIVCGILDAWGGFDFLASRRFIMPFVAAIMASVHSGVWWLGFLVLPTMGTLTLPYKGFGNFGRALWCVIQAVVAITPMALFAHFKIFGLTPHISCIFYVPWIILVGVLGGLYRSWNQKEGDFWVGMLWSSFIWGIY